MKLKDKLISGYAIALGIAGLGTLNGVWLGNQQHQQALTIRNQASKEQKILSRLQIDVLYNQPSKELFPYLQSPKDFQQKSQLFLTRLNEIKVTLSQYNASDQSGAILKDLPPLLKDYQLVVNNLIQETEIFVATLESMPETNTSVDARRALLITLIRSPEFTEFIEFPERLFPLSQQANQYEEKATVALQGAERLRTQVILLSLVLSMGISTLLSWYLSRSIAQPLAAVTQTAQRVTQDENFDLRVIVNSDDEVGTVAIALNQLIDRVGTLLEQQRASASLQELFQNEKMATLGKMVSEVAHEINNPVNFIGANLIHAQTYVDDLFSLLRAYDQAFPQLPEAVRQQAEAIDRPFLEKDLPKLLQSMERGATRAKQIALSLRNFSRLDDTSLAPVDLHICLEDTLLILNARLKQGITVQKEYGSIPPVNGYAGPLYQVFTNLIGNAIDALLEANIQQPEIKIKTTIQDNLVQVWITDNGPGINPDHLAHIFDALFTTKPIGMGTGLGLAISRQIVEDKHHGSLTCLSTLGVGTTFCVAIPAHPPTPAIAQPQNHISGVLR